LSVYFIKTKILINFFSAELDARTNSEEKALEKVNAAFNSHI